MKYLLALIALTACGENTTTESSPLENSTETEVSLKLGNPDCVDPDLSLVSETTRLMLCDGTVVTGAFIIPKPFNPENFIAENIKSGITIEGVTGTYEPAVVESVVESIEEVDLTNLSAENIKSGVTIAGVTGTYEDVVIQTVEVVNSPDLTNLLSSNIKSGVTIAGISGSLITENHSDCSGHGQTGCIATTLFKSTDLAGLTPAAVKSGVTVAGVTGDYPSASNPLAGSNNTADLDIATFDVRMKSVAVFEWFDAEGNRYSRSGDSDISAGNIKKDVEIFGVTGTFEVVPPTPDANDLRSGVTLSGVTGTLKTQCRNTGRLSTYDGPIANALDNSVTGGGANASTDFWDTVDDVISAGAYPTDQPLAWDDSNLCDGSDWTKTFGGGLSTSFNIYQDDISGLSWANAQSEVQRSGGGISWSGAVGSCESLSVGGFSDWRLPTQKEAMVAYAHGIGRIGDSSFMSQTPSYLNFWTSSNSSATSLHGWGIHFTSGETTPRLKTFLLLSMCVR